MDLLKLGQFLESELRPLGLLHEVNWILKELQGLPAQKAQQKAEEFIARRKLGEPLAYIFGHWEFRRLTLSVGPGVLIPRPETEELVEHALVHIQKHSKESTPLRVADLGAGSGAIAYSLLFESKKNIHVTAVENSPEAFVYLNQNKCVLSDDKKLKVDLLSVDWSELDGAQFDLIISNPPYVSVAEFEKLDFGVSRFEPLAALVPEGDASLAAFRAYESILELTQRALAPGGALLLEFGPAQEALWEQKMPNDFSWEIFKDLSSKPRFLYAFDFSPKNR